MNEEQLTETDLKKWEFTRRKWKHKLGLCYKASRGYTCHGGGENFGECYKV